MRLRHASQMRLRAEWQTGEYNIGIYLKVGNSLAKVEIIPQVISGLKQQCALRGAYALSVSWWGNGLPRR